MEDWPGRIIEVAGQTFEMTFEIAALVTAGPMKDTYLGSVEWGWESDAAGIVTLKPFRALASGAPTATFMGAAATWNAADVPQRSFWGGFARPDADAVDLPITTLPSGVQAAVDMTHGRHPRPDPGRGGRARRLGGRPERRPHEQGLRAAARW